MFKNYFKDRKKELFPEITDWTLDYNEMRFHKDVRQMDFKHWFWLHTTAYKIIYFGSDCVSMLVFGVMAGLIWGTAWKPLSWVFIFFVLYYTADLVLKVKDYKKIDLINFYDVYLRE